MPASNPSFKNAKWKVGRLVGLGFRWIGTLVLALASALIAYAIAWLLGARIAFYIRNQMDGPASPLMDSWIAAICTSFFPDTFSAAALACVFIKLAPSHKRICAFGAWIFYCVSVVLGWRFSSFGQHEVLLGVLSVLIIGLGIFRRDVFG